MKICVIGVGYIGLPTCAILASNGHRVIGVDINIEYINELNNRSFESKESDLLELINLAMDNNQLAFKGSPEKSDVFIICVPTPLKIDEKPDLSYIYSAVKGILGLIEKDNLIIIESTIPPGTMTNDIKPLLEESGFKVGEDVFLAYCPERVLPNNIVYELINNPRIIGGCTDLCSIRAKNLYRTFVKGDIIRDNVKNVEMVKLVENAYRDVNLAFSNELALLCYTNGVDPFRIIELANMHPRVDILKPGIGVGGHCIPVDSYFLLDKNLEYTQLIKSARSINDYMPTFVANKIINILRDIESPTVALWGVSYKADSGDVRNSPALDILKILKSNKIEVKVFDPLVYKHDFDYGISTLESADLLLLLVNHSDFNNVDFSKYVHLMKKAIIFDCINIINEGSLKDIKVFKLFNEVCYG